MSQSRTGKHPDIDALIAYADREPQAAGERVHIEQCAVCQSELLVLAATRQALRDLPTLPAPADGWDRLVAVDRHPDVLRNRSPVVSVMVAAGLIMGLVFVIYPALERDTDSVAVSNTRLIDETQQLERKLASLDRYQGAMDLETASRIATYEDTIRLIDTQLPGNVRSSRGARLWEQRNRLLRDLVSLRAQPMAANYRVY